MDTHAVRINEARSLFRGEAKLGGYRQAFWYR